MSIRKLSEEDIEVFSLETNISRSYTSSSINGSPDKLYLYPRRSPFEKESAPLSSYKSSFFKDGNINELLRILTLESAHSSDYSDGMENYLQTINSQSVSARKNQTVEILRYTPGYDVDKDFVSKQVIQNVLMPFYRTSYPTAHYNFTNYNSLNFFSSSNIPENSVLLYPQFVYANANDIINGNYIFSGAFSFDFWVKPTYTAESYQTGTIFHLSSSYCVSLTSGSSKDINGLVDKFRILVQLSSSADYSPSSIDLNNLPEFCYASEDNSLTKNNWQHVTIRWGTETINDGTGSIVINKQVTNFNIPSQSITPKNFIPVKDNPTVLCVGNYYEGTNTGTSVLANFFTTAINEKFGLIELVSGSDEYPAQYSFQHPLKSEIHELKIYNKFLSDKEVKNLETSGPNLNTENLIFYLPPFFTRESPTREVLTTPFFTEIKSTEHPFNIDLSFDIGGHYPNLENYTREFVAGNYPRLICLTGSTANETMTMPESANAILYHTSSNIKRLLTILPNDNGNFFPNFDWLSNLNTSSFQNDFGNTELGSVSLIDMYSTSSAYAGLFSGSSIIDDLHGADPLLTSSFNKPKGRVPTILQRTQDNSSYQVVIFDISNLYYGQQIEPNTFFLRDYLSGSDNKIHIELRDDGNGNIYRNGSNPSTWSSVGNIFYNEGVIILKNPSLYFFGQDNFSMNFKGKHSTHVLKLNCYALPLSETSSSNPSYIETSSSINVNDIDNKYVYITDLLIHDDNLNVIGRSKLAQPILKRTSNKILFKFSTDF